MTERSQTVTAILDAADALVLRDGVSKLTIAAVAKEASLSKGGVLYHFPSKERLISAMVERFAGRYDAAIVDARDQDWGPGAFTRAYAAGSAAASDTAADRIGAALLAAAASDPALLSPLQDRYQAWQSSIADDGIDDATATLVRLAVDGLWLAELLDLAPPSPELRARVLALAATLAGRGTP